MEASLRTVMRTVTAIPPSAPVSAAAQVLEQRGRRLVVVVDETRHPLGAITAASLPPAGTALDAAQPATLLPASTSVQRARELFQDEDLELALVVDGTGKLEGVVLASDLLSR